MPVTPPRRSTVPSVARFICAAGLAVVGSLSTGCVTEVVPAQPRGVASGPMNTTPPVKATPTPPSATSTTRVASAIKPLGVIPYDGLTLPLVTPDGRWVATQVGPIPPWEAVLAESGAAPVPASDIAAFEIIDGVMKPPSWPVPSAAAPSPRAGLLLGRCAGEGWVLVERPNENGSRWIGKLDLVSGIPDWLVQGEAVNAQGLLLRDGTLVYTRRAVNQAASELVFQPASPPAVDGQPAGTRPPERVVRREGWKFCQPVVTPDQSIVAVMAISAQTAELLAYSTTRVDATGVPLLIGRETLSPLSAAAAFQAVTSVEACPPGVESPLKTSILMVNADRRRMALWDPIRSTMNLLPASVMAAVRVHSPVASGLVMASSKGTDFWSGSGLPAQLVAGPYIPRTYGGADGTRLLLLSPQNDSPVPALRVMALEMVPPKP